MFKGRFMVKYLVHRRSGFTLVELSIVLVILGLLAGGVLLSMTMLKARNP